MTRQQQHRNTRIEARAGWRVQVLYTLTPARNVNVVLAAVGGRGDDAASTLNPVAGRGLTHLVRLGCALHQVSLMLSMCNVSPQCWIATIDNSSRLTHQYAYSCL